MTLKTLHIQRLTLVPYQPPEIGNGSLEEDKAAKNLDRERMARAVEITATTGASRQQQDSVHGVEPGSLSHFWAMGASDDESEEEAVDEDITLSTMLIREAMEAGFSMKQIQQAEEELTSPASSSKQVNKSSKLSMSSQKIDVWMENRRKKGNPCTRPLPKPRKSPLRTFGDALTLAMKNHSAVANDLMFEVLDRDQHQSPVSDDRLW
jgi:hypothetical protein